MRLFAAIDPPAEAVTDLDATIRRKGTGIRWVPPEQWHITTAFYGEVGPHSVDEPLERLEGYAARAAPMELTLAGAGCFPRRPNAARVLWAGVTGDVETLGRLAERCVSAGRRSGLEMERRKFAAHLTLARTRAPADLSGRLGELWSYRGPTWPAASLRLVRSTLGSEVRHETIAEWPLGAAQTEPADVT